MTPNPNLRDLGAAVEALRTMPDDRFDSHQRTAEALATLDVVLQLEARARRPLRYDPTDGGPYRLTPTGAAPANLGEGRRVTDRP